MKFLQKLPLGVIFPKFQTSLKNDLPFLFYKHFGKPAHCELLFTRDSFVQIFKFDQSLSLV